MGYNLDRFKNINMNLFVVFMAVYEENSFTKAAVKLGKGQPAVSNSIAKLRVLFNDRLFLMRFGVLTATANAEKLANILVVLFQDLFKAIPN
ncbi:LysR family transcriptional regulator [Pseudomonas syringae pv. dysoxyli]|uniref:LysR family transcriptional regulator n=1 Tax=Pseudomonas syringae TaxID=317 RepID=UPI001372CB5F|nr:LysR family transcriptional regulator [Pseudomonas syringae]NAO28859.1 LysR family transcriptional regulator [Pseudomonas syringae pv. dysoxyli]